VIENYQQSVQLSENHTKHNFQLPLNKSTPTFSTHTFSAFFFNKKNKCISNELTTQPYPSPIYPPVIYRCKNISLFFHGHCSKFKFFTFSIIISNMGFVFINVGNCHWRWGGRRQTSIHLQSSLPEVSFANPAANCMVEVARLPS